MSQPRRAKKIDANQRAIVKELRALPLVTVLVDVNDILVGYGLCNYLFEIKRPAVCRKDGTPRPSATKLSQVKMLRDWTGQYNIISTVAEILDIIGYGKRK